MKIKERLGKLRGLLVELEADWNPDEHQALLPAFYQIGTALGKIANTQGLECTTPGALIAMVDCLNTGVRTDKDKTTGPLLVKCQELVESCLWWIDVYPKIKTKKPVVPDLDQR